MPAGPTGKALVLGGGGVTGIAWSLGLFAGLRSAGLEFGDAHAVIGTSAGSTVGAQLTSGVAVDELYRRELARTGNESHGRMSASFTLRMGRGSLFGNSDRTGPGSAGRRRPSHRMPRPARRSSAARSTRRGGPLRPMRVTPRRPPPLPPSPRSGGTEYSAARSSVLRPDETAVKPP